jgi:hypothetical protein
MTGFVHPSKLKISLTSSSGASEGISLKMIVLRAGAALELTDLILDPSTITAVELCNDF